MSGGYFTRRPDESAVARSAALYLRLRQATVQHLSNVSRILNLELHRLAAVSKDQEKRELLRVTLDELKSDTKPVLGVREFFARRERFRRCLYQLAGNPFLELFLGITNLFGGQMNGAPIFAAHPERILLWESRQWRQGEAVLHGEAEVAQALVNQDWIILEEWLTPYGGANAVLSLDQEPRRAERDGA
jgi:DNA-binding GntR family transcriptional regulator